MSGAGATVPSPMLPDEKRAELAAVVSVVVSRGRAAIAHVEIELARVEHKVVDARTNLDDLRKVLDDLEASGERVGGSARG